MWDVLAPTWGATTSDGYLPSTHVLEPITKIGKQAADLTASTEPSREISVHHDVSSAGYCPLGSANEW